MKKGKYLFVQKNEKGNAKSLVLLSPTQNYGVIPQDLYEEFSGFSAVKLNEKTNLNLLKTVHKGAFVISLRSFQGGFEYSQYEGVVSPAYQVFYPMVEISDGFYKYFFKTQVFIDKMNSFTMSLRDGKNIAFSDFGNTYIIYPSFEEQQKISDYIDAKCSEIDALYADIEKQIDVLEQYKKSVITEAVTKGLNPNVEMKDSGIEWIGKIPKDWVLSRLKFYLQEPMKYGASETGVDYSDVLYRYIRITDIDSNGNLKNEGKLSLTPAQAFGYVLRNDTVLFARSGGTVGKSFLYKLSYGPSAFAGYLISAVTNSFKLYPKWLLYFTNTSIYWEWVNRIFTQATIQNIGADKYSNMPIVIAPIDKQESIIAYLDTKCAEIDYAIADKKKQLETLEAYKKSLIYEYVTGKKEVQA